MRNGKGSSLSLLSEEVFIKRMMSDEWLRLTLTDVNCNDPFLLREYCRLILQSAQLLLPHQHTNLLRPFTKMKQGYHYLCMPATTDIRGTSSPRSLSQNVVRGLAFEYEHEVLKGQYPQILTVRSRFPHGRPWSVHSGFKLSDHIVQAPPTLLATTSRHIYDVLVYSHLWCTCLLSNHSFN